MRAPSRSPPPATPPLKYEWFPFGAGTYINKSTRWIVIVGVAFNPSPGNSPLISITDPTGALFVDNFFADVQATGETSVQIQLSRGMLCPPGGQIQTLTVIGLSLVSCATLEDALAIL